jgi:pimeloyl-ACP methyl ester carboxylesterase
MEPSLARSDRPVRRFVHASGRNVHYLRMGQGSPVVLVHSSPTHARYVVPQMEYLAPNFTCFAFDTPGFGCSDALDLNPMQVDDLADALAANMRAVGLPPCPIFGTHSGAAIALALGVRHPELVTALILDGVPIFNADELETYFDGYFNRLIADPLGGHFSSIWTRFRDQRIWFPWCRRSPDYLLPSSVAPAEEIQFWVTSFLYGGRTYEPAYRAVSFYSGKAIETVARLTLPAVFTALETDMLYPHLERLPPLRSNQEIRQIGVSAAAKNAVIEEYARRYDGGGSAPFVRAASFGSACAIEKQFVDLPTGQMLVRYIGDKSDKPIIVLHDAPGSSLALEPMITALSDSYFVCAVDLPGCGESDALPEGARSIGEYAAAIVTACDQIGLARAAFYGVGFGASMALEIARRCPERVSHVILRGVLLPTIEERLDLQANYAPPIEIDAYGGHWYRTWLMLRDSLIYWPWYDRRPEALRRVPTDFDADRLHDWTFEVMKQSDAYGHLINTALRHDAARVLADIRTPLLLCADPLVPFFAYHQRLLALCPDVARCDVGSDVATHPGDVRAFLG